MAVSPPRRRFWPAALKQADYVAAAVCTPLATRRRQPTAHAHHAYFRHHRCYAEKHPSVFTSSETGLSPG